MSFNGNIDSVFTLAHEMGHSPHSWYSNHTQPFTYAEYRLFVAEVASTCNEALLIRYLLKHAKEKEEKIFLLNYFLDQFKGTVFRQTMFAEFEKRIHEKMAEEGTLTADGISELYLSINKEYFGPDMISDPQIALEWARIPHFYTPFYVYQYATGFSAAIAISSKILAGEPGIVEKYKQFLSGGRRWIRSTFEDLRRRYDEAGAGGRGAGCVCFLCGGAGEADRGSVSTGFKVA